MVNEEIDEDNDFAGGTCLRDEAKLEELLASKKERRTVSSSIYSQYKYNDHSKFRISKQE
jgi:hypothetical protein